MSNKQEATYGPIPDAMQEKAIAAIRRGLPTTYRMTFRFGVVGTTTGEDVHAFESVFIGNEFADRIKPEPAEVTPPAEQKHGFPGNRATCLCGVTVAFPDDRARHLAQIAAEQRAEAAPSIGDTCCGQCPGDTCCYVDGVTGERSDPRG